MRNYFNFLSVVSKLENEKSLFGQISSSSIPDFFGFIKSFKRIELKREMDNLYEVVEIPGKGLGCKALQDIKMGTLILKEKPQCVGQKEYDFSYASFESQINSFNSMSQQNKEEFLKLSNKYRNPKSIPTALKNSYSAFKKFVGKYMAKHPKADKNSILDIICIYSTNIWINGHGNSVKMKASRFNHSCRSNAETMPCSVDVDELEIRAVSNIKIGKTFVKNVQN